MKQSRKTIAQSKIHPVRNRNFYILYSSIALPIRIEWQRPIAQEHSMSDLSLASVAVGHPLWEDVKPQVNSEAEFLEIASDFGNPLEIVREAISNSVDAQAKNITIAFTVEEVDGAATLVITIEDDGYGMTRDVLARDFWGLGYSTSRDDRTKIGEKGHGTK